MKNLYGDKYLPPQDAMFVESIDVNMNGGFLYDGGRPNYTMVIRGISNRAPDMEIVGRNLLQYIAPEKVIKKCGHCGQWGAVQCACRSCGAPID
jgi:hypothetical protein